MNPIEYQKIVKKNSPKKETLKNLFWSFLGGGTVGVMAELIKKFIMILTGLSSKVASLYTGIVIVALTALLTGFGVFDNLVNYFKAGLFLPTTGFSHAFTSSAMDSKREGFIQGIGSSAFKMVGSVIISGVVSAFFLTILWVIIHGK